MRTAIFAAILILPLAAQADSPATVVMGTPVCNNTSLGIPDNNSAGVNSLITISDTSTLVGLTVSIKTTHSWVGDLIYTLSKGAGSSVLIDRPLYPAQPGGCSSNNIDVTLDDAAPNPVENECYGNPAALQGTFRPNNPVYNGQPWVEQSAAGTYTLNVADVSPNDTGALTQWCLTPAYGVYYTVTAGAPGGNGNITPASQSVLGGHTASFTVTPAATYHVVSVTGSPCTITQGSGDTWNSNAITQNCAVTAVFSNTFAVTASAPGGNGTITPASQSVINGNAASFTVTPAANFHVASVTGNTCTVAQGSGNTWNSSAITQNCAVTATFAPDIYNVTANSGGNGTITPPSQQVNGGNVATFSVTPAPNYHVNTVSGDTCSVAPNGSGGWNSSAITENCAVTATFAIDTYAVTASAPGGHGTITPSFQLVGSGTTASFTVTPAPNYHVLSVSGDNCVVTRGTGDNWNTNAITENCAVVAAFALDIFTVTATTVGGNGSITPSSQQVNGGNVANFTVTAAANYHPASVTGTTCSVTQGSGNSWNSNVITQNCAVSASFAIDIHSIGGNVSGLLGNSVTLSLNAGAQTLQVPANGGFQFPAAVPHGTAYAVTVSIPPSAPIESCTVINGSGTANATVANIQVSCDDVLFGNGFEGP